MAKKNSSTKNNRSHARSGAKTQAKGGRGLLYLVAGIALGVVAAGLLLLQNPQSGQKLHSVLNQLHSPHKPTEAKAKKVAATPKAAPVSTTPKFDFYTMLPQMQVDVDGTKATTPPPAPTTANIIPPPIPTPATPAPVSTAGGPYILQVASFRNFADADKVKANLTLQGFNVQVKPISVNGQTWNRVYVGPFSALAVAKNTQQDLAGQKINSIIVANGTH